jgi:hypothetical protein
MKIRKDLVQINLKYLIIPTTVSIDDRDLSTKEKESIQVFRKIISEQKDLVKEREVNSLRSFRGLIIKGLQRKDDKTH